MVINLPTLYTVRPIMDARMGGQPCTCKFSIYLSTSVISGPAVPPKGIQPVPQSLTKAEIFQPIPFKDNFAQIPQVHVQQLYLGEGTREYPGTSVPVPYILKYRFRVSVARAQLL